MLADIISTIILSIIRGTVFIFTITTLPIYYLIQRPWKTIERANAIRAVQLDPSNPSSPWKRVGSPPRNDIIQVQSIDAMLEKIMKVHGKNHVTFGVRFGSGKNAAYKWYTIEEIIKRVENIAKGFQLMSIKKGDQVLIFAETRLEWMLCAFAVYKLGATLVTLFAQLGHDGIIYGINQTKVKFVVTTKHQLTKLREVLPSTPSVVKVIDIDGVTIDDGPVEIVSLRQVETNGANSSLQLSPESPNESGDIAVIMYTSGTTGNPKGVMATHGQMIASATSLFTIVKDLMHEIQNHRYIACLPLGHMFEFAAEIFFLSIGTRIGYSSVATLVDGSPGLAPGEICDIKLLKPTIMLSVPLVLDRIRREIYDEIRTKPKIAGEIFNFLIDYKHSWRKRGYKTTITNFFLCRKAKEQLGGNLNYLLVGGAPISSETQKLISLVFNLLVLQGFGGTEVSGASHATDIDDLKFGRVGAPLYGVKVKLVDWEEGGYCITDKPNPRGEICISGDLVTSGYYLLEKETEEAFRYEDREKWYHSGDIGEVLPDGTFKIIDRKKDLVKLQNGEYFSLGKIEAALKSCMYIDNICVYGSGTNDFLVALVVPNQKALESIAKQLSVEYNSIEQLCENNKILNMIGAEISKYGQKNGLNKREVPLAYKLCSEQWTPENGLLTAALKLKRLLIISKYKQDINNMFDYGINNNK